MPEQCCCLSKVAMSPLNPSSGAAQVTNLCMFFPTTHVQQVYIILCVVIIEITYVICAPSLWPLTPQVHPQRLLNSVASTEVQTNRTPRGDKATSGNGQCERSPAYWCENDHYWGEKKRSDGVDWAADRVGGGKGDKTKPPISDSGSEINTFWAIVLGMVVWI